MKTPRTCSKGHRYFKSSDCPTCPVCEAEKKAGLGFLSLISAPARRALENQGIKNISQLSKYTEKELLQFHGLGPSTLPKLRKALSEEGLSFKSQKS